MLLQKRPHGGYNLRSKGRSGVVVEIDRPSNRLFTDSRVQIRFHFHDIPLNPRVPKSAVLTDVLAIPRFASLARASMARGPWQIPVVLFQQL
jgi:hypothetical protein